MLKTREQLPYKLDDIHLTLEISNVFFKEKGARMQGVTAIEKTMKEDLAKEKTEEKGENDERFR